MQGSRSIRIPPLLEPAVAHLEVGVDEVGRGALAGPVVAAAVIMPPLESIAADLRGEYLQLRDSKKLSRGRRERLAEFVKAVAIDYGVGSCSSQEVDAMNIMRATHAAMHRALDALRVDFDHIVVDGDRFQAYRRPGGRGRVATHECVVGGDDRLVSIAAASILAKVHRDAAMAALAGRYDAAFGWDRNAGYGTAEHVAAIRRCGPCPLHRRTFLTRLLPSREPIAP